MFNQWWFKLYTKHYLSDLGKAVALCIAVDQLITNFAGPFIHFAPFAAAGPLFLLFKRSNSSLRGNIEFHKMSVPFPELKAALFKDIVLSIGMTFAGSLIVVLCSIFFGGVYSTAMGADLLRIVSPGMGLFGLCLAFVTACYQSIIHKDRKYLLLGPASSRLSGLVNVAGTTLIGFMFLAIMMALIPTAPLVGFLTPSSIFLGALLFHQKAIFNQYRPKGRVRDFAKFWGQGLALCCCLYFLCLQVSRQDVLNENLHPMQRASSFEFNSRYNPEIDVETYKAIEKHVAYNVKEDLFKSLAFNPSTVGLEFYLDDDPYAGRLVVLLKFSKPTPEFLVVLYDHFEKNPEYWKNKKHLESIHYLSYIKWPKNEKLPDRFIAHKQTSKELHEKRVVEYKLKEKARREMASEEK